jgi:hypothetical protein
MVITALASFLASLPLGTLSGFVDFGMELKLLPPMATGARKLLCAGSVILEDEIIWFPLGAN